MVAEVDRIRGAPGDEPSFRAYDLNEALSPTREMICSPDDLTACFVDDLPARAGPAYLGIDIGEATSATAACAIWPADRPNVETWMAFGDVPPLRDRQRRDSAPYVAMEARGELRTYPGRVVRPDAFLADLQADLAGCHVEGAALPTATRIRRPRTSSTARPCAGLSTAIPPRRRRQGLGARTFDAFHRGS